MSELIIDLLEDVLGSPKNMDIGKGEVSFDCPTCSQEKGMYEGDGKGNLEVNVLTGVFQCWACSQTHGTKGTIKKLLKRYGNKEHLKKYELLIPEENYADKKEKPKIDKLNKEFIPLLGSRGRESEKALKYLYSRGYNDFHIKKFNIHYAVEGDYKGRIIVPSLSVSNTYNYFVSRTYGYQKPKYLNPEADKNILIFNEGLINWDSSIYLVEGVFDHMVVPNSIPMLGKVVSDHLLNTILFYHNKINSNSVKINICLDDDAWRDSIELYRKLISINKLSDRIRVIKMPQGYDLSLLHEKYGVDGIKTILRKSIKIKESLL